MAPLPTPALHQLVCAVLITMTSLPASALESETCFSRQHRGATVTVQPALNRTAAAMDARLVHSERDCVLACCSEEVRPGARCNMVLFNGKKPAGEENCFLFHCDGEQDCPLMKAPDGVNTYNIYKGLIHPPTLRPVTMTTTTTDALLLTTVLLPTTTVTPTTTTQAPVTTTAPPPVITTQPTVTAPPATTTKTTSAAASPAPTLTSKRPNKTSRKQNKSTKKGKSHGISTQPPLSFTTALPVRTDVKEAGPQRTTETPRLQAGTSTTASTTTVATAATATTATATAAATTAATTTPATTAAATTAAATTTNAPPTTTTTSTPTTTVSISTLQSTTTRATAAEGLIIVPKEAVQANHVLQNSGPAHGKTAATHGALKSGMVAFMVLALAVLTLALAVGGRKAMESFDRRHYTRLELNDLHYEV
ncbi:MANSC domain-containing protein 1 [Oryzias melastigma]|uniref:MANSC domain-containing protein 1 n=1 Tax=Oryzias melastigma TaxID=30732 RepID=UPI000CF7B9C1|nr:MANSC domain-containing protein 1 [Oryzias melastigma]